MKKNYQTTEVSVILFENQDMLTASGVLSDEAIVNDRSWTKATSTLSDWQE